MKITQALTVLILSGLAIASAQQTSIDAEVGKLSAKMSSQGFVCRTEKTGHGAAKIEVKMQMSKDVLYYIAVVTGKGETAVHPASVTLVNQNKKAIPLEAQSLEFGSALQLHPLTDGMKTLKFVMKRKTNYALAICTNTAALYHTDQKNSPLDDHAHF
ncbi:MAG: hypothetical protein U1F27_05220 [Turneriella sp.]